MVTHAHRLTKTQLNRLTISAQYTDVKYREVCVGTGHCVSFRACARVRPIT
jgi:hypothetical protein